MERRVPFQPTLQARGDGCETEQGQYEKQEARQNGHQEPDECEDEQRTASERGKQIANDHWVPAI
jgi:hypothetical protein